MRSRSLRIPTVPRPLRFGGVVLVAGVIVYFSLFDAPVTGTGQIPLGPFGLFYLDKWFHAVGYAALAGALGYAALTADTRTLLGLFLVATGFGILIELLQAPLPERAFSYADMVADSVGALIGLAVWKALVGLRLVETTVA